MSGGPAVRRARDLSGAPEWLHPLYHAREDDPRRARGPSVRPPTLLAAALTPVTYATGSVSVGMVNAAVPCKVGGTTGNGAPTPAPAAPLEPSSGPRRRLGPEAATLFAGTAAVIGPLSFRVLRFARFTKRVYHRDQLQKREWSYSCDGLRIRKRLESSERLRTETS